MAFDETLEFGQLTRLEQLVQWCSYFIVITTITEGHHDLLAPTR